MIPGNGGKGYNEAGASYTKKALKGFTVASGSPAEDIDLANYTLRQRSRMLYMAAPIATGALKRLRTNVVGPGLRLQCAIDRKRLGMSQTQAEAWQRHTQAEFALWAERKSSCDATGMNDFYGMQQLIMLSWPMSGDVFSLIKRRAATMLSPYTLRLHIVEADRIRTPVDTGGFSPFATTGKNKDNGNTIYDGVEIDSDGMVVAYHIASTHPGSFSEDGTTWQRVEAYGAQTGLPNVLHIMDSERPDQYRGVPYLAQCIEPILQLRRYTESEIMAALVQSFYTAFITTEAPASAIPFNEVGGDGVEPVSEDPNEYEMGPGTVNVLKPGEGVSFGTPSHPNTGFNVFMRAMCELVGAALEIPADLLLMAFNGSYSASRGALLEAWKAFRMRREWLTRDFCNPVFEIWLTEAVASGRISAPGFLTDPLIRQAYLGCKWIGPSQGQLDPTKEVAAAVTAIENGLSDHEQEAIKLNGSEFSANVEKLAVENAKLRKANGGAAPAVKQKTPPEEEEQEEEGNDNAEE